MAHEVIGDCILYHGDALEIIPNLVESNILADMVLSDIPYLIESGGNSSEAMSGCFGNKDYDNSGHIVTCDIEFSEIFPLLYNVLSEGHCLTMVNNRNVQNMLNEAENAGFYFHNLLIWDKGTVTPNRWYMKGCEFVGMFKKGKAKNINNCSAKTLVKYPHTDETNHPTEKPVGLMKYYIENSTQAGETVIDPFMGVGSTGVACVKSNRNFIGIEIEQEWFDIACERITEIYERPVQEALI